MNDCCSDSCKEIVALPYEEQKALRRGKTKSNLVFKKGRSEVLTFKNNKVKDEMVLDVKK